MTKITTTGPGNGAAYVRPVDALTEIAPPMNRAERRRAAHAARRAPNAFLEQIEREEAAAARRRKR